MPTSRPRPPTSVSRRARARVSSDASVLAAIDVGTNAVRLEIARVLADGALETLHQERDPVRPGEGMFVTGEMPRGVADRLLSTLRRYAALCRRYGATTRAVATSAVREAKNRGELLRRVRKECGLELEVVSGHEEARLICQGVLHGRPPSTRSLLIDIGGGSTEVASARGEKPEHLWSIALGAVRISELFGATDKVGKKKLRLMRDFAAEAFLEAVPRSTLQGFRHALGSSGTINAVVGFAADEDSPSHATLRQISRAVEALAQMNLAERRKRFESRRAEIIVGGAVVLEEALRQLGLSSITAVSLGLRNGVLLDLLRRTRPSEDDHSLSDAALALGRRFGFDADHGRQTARLAVQLFDDLAGLHRLPASTRPLLEVAALLHDLGHTVSYQRHHKHSHYLIQHAELPGLSDRERGLVALMARFHRRSPPDARHPDLVGLPSAERLQLKKLATLLRVADSLDRSHHQPVRAVNARVRGGAVQVRLAAKVPVDLELWDAAHEAELFRRVFGKKLELHTTRAATQPLSRTSR